MSERINPYDAETQPVQFERWFNNRLAQCANRSGKFANEIRPQKTQHKRRTRQEPHIATCDFETDPFRGEGYPVKPFAAGFYDGTTYWQWWGSDCATKLARHIEGLETPHIVYAHNGGKFDFMFLLDHIERDVFCIGPRIVKAFLRPKNQCGCGTAGIEWRHELRDSLAIIPVPLKHAAEKGQFDYDRMLEENRERWKVEILAYLKQDCIGLYETVLRYRNVFGNALTMAGAAMKKLDQAMEERLGRKRASRRMEGRDDEYYRKFYYGGRVQAFEQGIIEARKEPLKIFDINSSYPNVMGNKDHPIGVAFTVGSEIDEHTDFATIDAVSNGSLPLRDATTGKLEFPNDAAVRRYYATGHEIRAALELGLLNIHRIIETRTCIERSNFAPFIDTYWRLRKEAKAMNDLVFDLFWKLVMNSAYGKFAQNPRKFKDVMICRLNEAAPDVGEGWVLEERLELMDVYSRKLIDHAPQGLWRSYLNVATGASITGAARASLLRGLALSERPIYCDTDSIMVERMGGSSAAAPRSSDSVSFGSDLGAWKLEHEGDYAAVCARKLYGFFGARSDDPSVEAERVRRYRDPYCIKIASKGVRLTAAQILAAAKGSVVEWQAEAPTFRKDGSQWWQKRRVRMAT